MYFGIGLVIFLVGISIGSFLNVLVWRSSHKRKFKKTGPGLFDRVSGRSFCDFCHRQLVWWENIPLLSFLFLKGRCRTCRSPIPLEYFLVELMTGLGYLLIFNQLLIADFQEILRSIIYCLLITLLIIIFLFDLHYQIIPDWSIVGLMILTLLVFSLNAYQQPLSVLGHSALAGFLGVVFFLFLHLITRGRGMGLGDVKFVFWMGLFLGPIGLVIALYLAFLTGAIIGGILILLKKRRFGQHISFGPFLVWGVVVSWFWSQKIISLLMPNF